MSKSGKYRIQQKVYILPQIGFFKLGEVWATLLYIYIYILPIALLPMYCLPAVNYSGGPRLSLSSPVKSTQLPPLRYQAFQHSWIEVSNIYICRERKRDLFLGQFHFLGFCMCVYHFLYNGLDLDRSHAPDRIIEKSNSLRCLTF